MNIIAFSIKYLQNKISIKVISFLRQTKTVTSRYGFISLSILLLKYGKPFKRIRSYSNSICPLIPSCINSIKSRFLLSDLAVLSSLFLFIRFFASILQAQIDKIITSYLELQTISKSKVN